MGNNEHRISFFLRMLVEKSCEVVLVKSKRRFYRNADKVFKAVGVFFISSPFFS